MQFRHLMTVLHLIPYSISVSTHLLSLEPILCDVGEFLCGDQLTCVSENWLCDGEPDCPDGSDEALDKCK